MNSLFHQARFGLLGSWLLVSILLQSTCLLGGSTNYQLPNIPNLNIRYFYEEALTMRFSSPDPVNQAGVSALKSSIIVDKESENSTGTLLYSSIIYHGNMIDQSWTSDYLQSKGVGIYTLYKSLGISTGQYEEKYQSIALGYKGSWGQKSDAAPHINTTGIVNTSTTTSGSSFSRSNHEISNVSDSWMIFQLTEPLVANALINYQNDYFTISFEGDNEEGVYVKMTPSFNSSVSGATHLGEASYVVEVQTKLGSSYSTLGTINASVGEHVLIKRTSSGAYSVWINDVSVGGSFTVSASNVKYINYRAYVHDGFQIGVSDVLFSSPIAPSAKPSSYHPLKLDLNSGHYNTVDKHVYFHYRGEYNSGNLNYKVKNELGVDVTLQTSLNVGVKTYGENRFILDANQLSEGYYTLMVTNEKNEKYYLRFYNKN